MDTDTVDFCPQAKGPYSRLQLNIFVQSSRYTYLSKHLRETKIKMQIFTCHQMPFYNLICVYQLNHTHPHIHTGPRMHTWAPSQTAHAIPVDWDTTPVPGHCPSWPQRSGQGNFAPVGFFSWSGPDGHSRACQACQPTPAFLGRLVLMGL